jgi:hypothetical protein
VTSMLFNTDPDLDDSPIGKVFGERYNGRYHLPLLGGEKGTKSGGDWVPYGVQSATNLAGSIVESRMLGVWERERGQLGMAQRPDLVERLAFIVNRARAQGVEITRDETGMVTRKGVDFADLKSSPEGKALRAELELIHAEAKQTAGGNLAAQQGTNRHDVWEERARTSQLFGTPEVNEQIGKLEQLLTDAGLERVPGLQERTVRNTSLRAAGRFDDVLRTTRDVLWETPGDSARPHFLPAGTLLMADLKTKKRAFYSWLEVRIQLTVYATAEWMLADHPLGGLGYAPGPKHHVNQQWGVVLWMPSNGDEPALKRCNLVKGWEHAQLARAVCDARSEAKNVAAHGEAMWV